MPGKVTKQFAHLSVLIDLVHFLHHNQKIKELRDTLWGIKQKKIKYFVKLAENKDFQVLWQVLDVRGAKSTPVSWEEENPPGIILV